MFSASTGMVSVALGSHQTLSVRFIVEDTILRYLTLWFTSRRLWLVIILHQSIV